MTHQPPASRRLPASFLVLCACLSLPFPAARAVTQTWLGNGADGNWNTAGNFSPGGVTAASDLEFDGNNHLTDNNNNIGFGSVRSLTFNAGSGAFTFTGNGLGTNSGVTNLSANLQTISLLQFTVLGSQTWDVGTAGLRITSQVAFFSSGALLTITGSGNTSIEGDISELLAPSEAGGSLIKTGTGTLTLTGSTNYYRGGTTVNGGLIAFTSAGNFGSGNITLDGGGLQWAAGNTTDISSRLNAFGAGGAVFDTNGNDVTLAGDLGGTGGLTKTGTGMFTLIGTNTYTGGTTINAGTLAAGSDTALGAGDVTVDDTAGLAATLRINAGVTLANAVTLQDGGTLDNRGTLAPAGYYAVTVGDGGGAVVNTGELRNAGGSGPAVSIDNATFNTLTNTGGTLAGYSGVESSIALVRTIVDVDGWPTYVNNEGGLYLTNGNGGAITGTDGAGVSASNGTDNRIVNTGGSLIEGGWEGVYLDTGTLRNEAGSTIRGDNGYGVELGAGWLNTGSTVTNTGSGSLIEGDEYGVYATNTGFVSQTVINTDGGIIRSATTGDGEAGVYMDFATGDLGTGTVTNDAGSLIEGRKWGVYMSGGGTVTNGGAITGALAPGSQNAGVVFNLPSGYSVGNAKGTLTNTGTVNGGVRFINLIGILTNTGVINGGVTMANKVNQVTLGTGSLIDGALNIGTSTSSTLTLAGATGSQVYSQAVTGATTFSGKLTKKDAGAWIIDTALTTTQPVTISGGTLQLGNGGATGSLAGNITDNATLAFDRSDTSTYAGVISGAGAVKQTGTGTTILTGTSTYTGATAVSGGTLAVNGTLRNSAVTVQNGGVLGGTGTIGGSVTVENGGILSPGNSPGTLTVGSLTLNSGSLLDYQLDTPGVTGGGVNDLVAVTGNLTLDGILNLSPLGGFGTGAYTLITYGGTLAGSGSDILFGLAPAGYNLTVDTATAGQVNLTVDYTGLQFWDGAQTTPDNIVHGGDGTWDTTTANWTNENGNANAAWAGLTAVFSGATGGTVTVADDVSVAGLQFATDGYTLAGGGGSLVITDPATEVRIDPDLTATLSVAITGMGGLTKTGGGTIILDGANTYAGGTTITAGTLQISADANLGDTAGGLTFNGGTLATTADLTTTRDVTLAGVGTLDTAADTTLTAAGIFSGAGSLTKTGDGTLILTGTNTYAGGTTVTAGTLQGDTTSLQGDIANNAAVLFEQTAAGAYAGDMSGTGALTKTGAGTLTLTGTNTYTGGTTVTAGTLQGDTTSLQGDIANDAAVIFDQTANGTYAGVLSGIGTLTKTGAGALTLDGDSTYTGATQLDAGALLVNGSLGDTAVTVGSGATLGGSGTIAGDVTVQSGGTLSPGNSPGLLTVGSLTLENGSTTRMAINGAGTAGVDYDQIHVTDQAMLGGTLELVPSGYAPKNGDSFTLIQADGGIASDFTAVNGLGNALVFTTTITDDYTLTITAAQTDFATFAKTPNQQSVAQNLDSDWASPALSDVVAYLDGLPGTSLPAAFDQIAPTTYTALSGIAGAGTHALWTALGSRLAEVRAGSIGWSTTGLNLTDRTEPLLAAAGDTGDSLSREILAAKQADSAAPRRGFFVSGAGTFGGEDSGSVPGFDFATGSLLLGADTNLTPDLAVGVMTGYDHTHAEPDNGGAIDADTARLGLYGTWSGVDGGWLNASAGGAYHWYDTRRAGLGGTATARPRGAELNALLEAGRDFTSGRWTFTPSAGVNYLHLRVDGFNESGSLAPLSIETQNAESLRSELALTLSRRIQTGKTTWSAWAKAGWAHEFLDTQQTVSSHLASGAGGVFSVQGNRAPRDGVLFAAGIRAAFSKTLSVSVAYSGDYNADYLSHSINASLRLCF